MNRIAILSAGFLLFFFELFFSNACTKSTTPPIHDTVTLVKNDTTTLMDTIYGTKPDPTVNLSKGLLLYLPFDGNLADSSGNGNPESAVNGASLTFDTHGYANNALATNGTNQELVITNNGSINFDTTFSVSLDFMTNDLSSRQSFITMANFANGEGPSFEIGNIVGSTPGNFAIAINSNAVGCISTGGVSGTYFDDTTAFIPALGAWYNVIVIYDKGTLQFYLNGRLYDSKTGGPAEVNFCSASNIMVGGWWSGDPATLNGKLDNVRLYNRVLTPHEIVALAANYQVTSTNRRQAVQPGQAGHF